MTNPYIFLTLFFSGQVLLPQRGKEEELISASQWELLNLDVDTILQMPSEVQALTSLEHHEFMEIMSKYLYESIGTQEFVRRHMLTQSPCIVVPSTLHISLTKAATILGLGRESLVSVAVDENSRMDPTGNVLLCFIHTVFSIYIVLMYFNRCSTLVPSVFIPLDQRSGKAPVLSSSHAQNGTKTRGTRFPLQWKTVAFVLA